MTQHSELSALQSIIENSRKPVISLTNGDVDQIRQLKSRPVTLDAAPRVSDLRMIRRLPGTHRPWLCTDGADQYVIKPFKTQAQADEECLADRLYRAAAIPVPESWVIDGLTGPARLSRWIEGEKLGQLVTRHQACAYHERDIIGGLALDIIFQNDDVLGRHGDNIIIGYCPAGDPNFRAAWRAWRVDNGSALRWSATEGPRYNFGPVPDLRWLDGAWPSLIFDAGARRSNPPNRRHALTLSFRHIDPHWNAVLASAPEELRATLDARWAWLHRHVNSL